MLATPSSSAVSVRMPTPLALENGVGGYTIRSSFSNSSRESS